MNFKLEEFDEGDEEETEPSNEDDHDDNEEYVPYGFDEKDESEDANRIADASEEPENDYEEEEDEYKENDDTSDLILKQRISVPPFSQKEEDNFAYAEAVMAYYEEKNYEIAIEKFDEAIKSEKKGKRVAQLVENEIVAKSLYWQAESYVKTQDIAKAIKTFESLVKTCKEHYLTLSAQRRAEILKAKHL